MKIGITKRNIKRLALIAITGIILCPITIFLADVATNKGSKNYLYKQITDTPTCKAGLLLGTSKYLRSGSINPYFAYRIDAAVELYENGKISHIIISGDHSRTNYNEPQDMKDNLVKRGVPASRITLDYAGFNTYDSVHRMKQIFGQDEFIVISQKFHNQRAVYIAHWAGLNAYGYNAQDVSVYFGLKVNAREKLARVKMFIDLISNRNPKFLGEQILLPT